MLNNWRRPRRSDPPAEPTPLPAPPFEPLWDGTMLTNSIACLLTNTTRLAAQVHETPMSPDEQFAARARFEKIRASIEAICDGEVSIWRRELAERHAAQVAPSGEPERRTTDR